MKCPICKEEFKYDHRLGNHLMSEFGPHEYNVEELFGMLFGEVEMLKDRIRELDRRITFGK